MNNLDERSVQYIAESHAARLERSNRRMFVLCIILIVALIATNGLWFWYESQFEDISYTQDVDSGETGNAIANIDGEVVFNGESQTNG